MLSQQLIDGHADRLRATAKAFADEASEPVGQILNEVVSYLGKERKNPKTLVDLPKFVERSIARSGYYSVGVAFASDLTSQIDEFFGLYSEMRHDLPVLEFSTAHAEQLTEHAVAAASVIEAEASNVVTNIVRSMAHSMGVSDAGRVVRGVSEDISRLARVEPIFLEQSILYFRNVGRLFYSALEQNVGLQRYLYVGPNGKAKRDFCKDLIGQGKTHTMADVLAMDNGQVGDALVSCGGHGCMHWWAVAP